jgi:hypothetical protein
MTGISLTNPSQAKFTVTVSGNQLMLLLSFSEVFTRGNYFKLVY